MKLPDLGLILAGLTEKTSQKMMSTAQNTFVKTTIVAFALLFGTFSNAQIFQETFNDGNNATTGFDDIGAVTWQTTCTPCLDVNDYFKIVGGELQNQDSNGPAVWETTSLIDITSCPFIEITMDITTDDDMEGCGTGCNSVDWIQLEYNIDNTGWQVPDNSSFCAGPCADVDAIHADDVIGTLNYTTGCIVGGSDLQLRITCQTWAGAEHWNIDNVTVGCGSEPTIDAGMDLSVCNGESVTLTATNPDNANLTWSFGVVDGVAFTATTGSNYFVVTADQNGCTSQDSLLLTAVDGPAFTLTSSPASGCTPPFDGIITISGLTPGFTYDLTYVDSSGTVGPNMQTANGSGQIVLLGVGPGFYTNFIVDSSGCISVNTIGITLDPPVLVDVDAGNTINICEGDSVALAATVSHNGTITWNNGITDGVYFTPPVGATIYTVVLDTVGCTDADSVAVNVTAVPNVNVPNAGPFAEGAGIQSLTATPPGGTWSADCGACINPTTGDFDPALAGIGAHTICYTAGTAPCEDSMCITIYVNDGCALLGNITPNNPTCFGLNDGSATINVQFETGNVTYVIQDSLGNQVNVGNSNTANNLTEGWYYFTITDEFPCTFIDSVYLQDPGQMSVDLDLIAPTCYGVNDGMAIADTVYSYTGSYNQISYVWAPNTGSNGIGEDTLFNAGGQTTLLITDENGCNETIDFDLTYPDSLYFSQFGYEPAYCRVFPYQSGNGVVFVAASGGVPNYTYLWEEIGDTNTHFNTTWGGLNPGDYAITVTDANGCILQDTITVDSLNPVADFTVTSAQLNADLEGTAPVDVHFVNQSQNFANPNNPLADTTFFWNFGDGNWIISNDYFEEFDWTYTTSGVYDICLVAINKNGCADTLCKLITIFDLQSFTPINIFTPNNDGNNDLFSFVNLSTAIVEFKCIIVNRWGWTVAELNDINGTWDGTDKSGSPCKEGVYFYTYVGTAQNSETIEGQGTVTLIRD